MNYTAALYYYDFEEISEMFEKKTVLYIIIVGTYGMRRFPIVQNGSGRKKNRMIMIIDFIP